MGKYIDKSESKNCIFEVLINNWKIVMANVEQIQKLVNDYNGNVPNNRKYLERTRSGNWIL